MNFIKQIKIKTRIIVLVLIPVIVTFFFAIQRYHQASQTLNNIQQLEILEQYIAKTSPLISALFQERLMTKLYVALGEKSEIGLEYKQDLLDSQNASKQPLANYQAFVANKEKLAKFPRLLKDIETVNQSFDAYQKARILATQKKRKEKDPATGKTIRTLGEMNAIVNALISSTQQVVLLSASNEQLSLLTSAYQSLSYAQDALMLIIGNVHEVTSNKMSPTTYANLARQVGEEKVHLKNFASYAPKNISNFSKKELTGQKFYQEAQDLYEKIRRSKQDDFGKPIAGDTDAWFEQGEKMRIAYNKVNNFLLNELKTTKKHHIS